MKKILLIALFLISNLILAQGNPNPFPRGIDTKYIALDTLTTAQRDAITLKASKGYVIFNADTNTLNMHNGTSWGEVTGGATTPATVGEINTGADNTKMVTPLGLAGSNIQTYANNGQTAYSWGNHAGLYKPIGYAPDLQEVTDNGKYTTHIVEVEGVKFNNLRLPATSNIIGTTGSSPKGIVIDGLGNIYTANEGDNNVTKITPDGTLSILGTTGSYPNGITIDDLGNIYTANRGSDNVTKITPAGVSTIFATTGSYPYEIIIDDLGNIYTANSGDNNVSKITPAGVSTIFATTGHQPLSITIDSEGNIYTTNYSGNNVTKITPEGVSSIIGTTGNQPSGILIDSYGNIYTCNYNTNNVTKITPNGTSTIFGTTGKNPSGIIIDKFGNIYTTNAGGDNNVTKITPAGVSTIYDTTEYNPKGIIIDDLGNIYTANSGSNNVSKITPQNHFLSLDSDGNIITKPVEVSTGSGNNIDFLEYNKTDKTVWNNGNGAGSDNTSFGQENLISKTTGSQNSAFGNHSLPYSTTGSHNSAFGDDSGAFTSDGDNLTMVNSGLFLGDNSRSLANNSINEIVIGADSVGNGNNTATLGNDSTTDTYLKGIIHGDGSGLTNLPNVTHTGEVTGATALTVNATAVSNKTLKSTLAGTEEVLINDAGTLKKTTTQDIADLGGGGISNPNIVAITTEAQLIDPANAGKILDIQGNFSLTANRTLLSDQSINITTGLIDLNGFELDFNGASLTFAGKNKGIDAFTGKLKGVVKLQNAITYASNYGLKDDNLESTDNNVAGNNALHCVNQNSGHFIFNKQSTGFYYTMPHDFNPAGTPPNVFFPNNYTQSWKIGNGFNNVTIEFESGVEIKSIRNDKLKTCLMMWYNTRNSLIKGGTLRGDRYVHRYNRTITVTTAAATAGTVSLTINEPDNYNSTVIINTINVNIPLTVSNADTNATEIASYINANIPGYVAVAAANVVTYYKEGCDFKFTVNSGTTGLVTSITADNYEWGHGFIIGSMSLFNKVDGTKFLEFHGDGIDGGQQGNGTISIRFTDLTQGFISETGTIDGNTGYYYSNIRSLPNPHEWFSLAANAQSSVDLLHFKYWVLFYDASDNFLFKSKSLIPYERYAPRVFKDGRPEAAKYRILVENNGTKINDFWYFINSRSYALGNVFENIEVGHNRRQGISNPGIDFQIKNSWIHDTGGTEPQFGIDVEDDHKHPMGWKIIGCHFWNNANGDIILKGASNGLISENFFKQDSWNLRINVDAKGNALDTGYSRKIIITNNFFEHKTVSIDIGTIFSNNQLFYSSLIARAGGSLINNNIFEDGTINDGTYTASFNSQSAGGNSMNFATNNIFKITDSWGAGNKAFITESNNIVWNNNTYLFNDRTSIQGAINDESLRTVFINDTGTNYIRSRVPTTDVPERKGFTNTETVLNLTVNPTYLHWVGWTKYASDLKDFNYESSLIFEHGFKKSFKIQNGKTKGWLNLKLNEFPSDGIAAFETIIIKDVDIYIPARTDATRGYLVNTAGGSTEWTRIISIAQDKNVNIEFINCRIKSDDLATTRAIYLGHRGTTLFKDCYWDLAAPNTIDFTVRGVQNTFTNFRSTNNGVITMIGNRSNGNASFVMDTGDVKIDY